MAFEPDKIGIKGSPTIVGKAFTPPPKKAGERVQVADIGLKEMVADALQRIGQAGVIEFLKPLAQVKGGAR